MVSCKLIYQQSGIRIILTYVRILIGKTKRKNLRYYFDVHETKTQFDILTQYFHEIFIMEERLVYAILDIRIVIYTN